MFNINVQMPPATPLEQTLGAARGLLAARAQARPGELNATLATAGLQFTPSELAMGEHLGQVTVSLAPESAGGGDVPDFVAALRPALKAQGAENIDVQVLSADLPMLSNLSLRLSGAPMERLAAAAADLHRALEKQPGFSDIRKTPAPASPA